MRCTSLFSLMTLLLLTTTTTTTTMAQNNDNYIGSTPSQRLYINAVQAQTAVNAALAQAIAIGSPSNIAITDPSGLLVAFLREDNAFPASIDISIKKARTVSLFNGAFTTAALYSQAQPGASLYGIEQTNGGLVVFGGGVPIYVGNHFIGGLGVSGGTTDQDISVAMAGVMAIGSVNATG